MPKKPGDDRKVIAGLGAIEYTCPTPSEWAKLQKKLNCPLSPNLRDQLTIATMMYAIGGFSKRLLTLTEAKKKITDWQRRTRILRNQIWGNTSTRSNFNKPNRETVALHYLNSLTGTSYHKIRAYPFHSLAFFALALDAVLVASEVCIDEITDAKYPGDREYELWSVWVALLIALMNDSGMPVAKRTASGETRLSSDFVTIVGFLQKTLPEDGRRRTEGDSLRQGIRDVVKLGNPGFEAPFLLMALWGALGNVDLEKDRLNSSTTEVTQQLRAYLLRLEQWIETKRARKISKSELSKKSNTDS
jgi:hypothetical protein